MADYADRFAEKQEDKLAFKIKAIYKDAAKDIKKKYEAWERDYRQQDAHMRSLLNAGKIDNEAYRKWQKEEVFKGKIWQQKLHDMTQVYVNADEKARQLLSGTQKNVFVEAANYTAYDVDQHVGGGVAFTLYDKNTVDTMLRNDPKMLPEWKINEKKDYSWNERRLQNAITQGIIQGESIPAIGKRLTEELGASNSKQMTMFARTAMTGAHNAGRMERLHEAQDMGIEVKKQWLAAKDDKVRDTHEYLDGQIVDVDEPFRVGGMEIMFPGDPSAPPELVYNCRCTMVYVYPKYQKNVSTKNTQPYEKWKEQRAGDK